MEHVDPYAVMRNSATLEAYRARYRAALWAGQPFLTIAAVLTPLSLTCGGLFLFGPVAFADWRINHAVELASILLLMVAAVCSAIAGYRRERYLKDHPFDPRPSSQYSTPTR